jgi:hypothetical protein
MAVHQAHAVDPAEVGGGSPIVLVLVLALVLEIGRPEVE